MKMEKTSEFLRRMAQLLDEPADYKKLMRISFEISDCADGLIATAVEMYCKGKDDLFVRNLQAGRPKSLPPE